MFWGRLYRQVYELDPTEAPEQKIIDDDEAFDRWREQRERDVAQQAARMKSGNTPAGHRMVDPQMVRGNWFKA